MPDLELDSSNSNTPLPGGLRIVDDTPRTLLRLGWIGQVPYRWIRLAAPCLLLLFIWGGTGEKGIWDTAWKQINAPGPRDLIDDVILGSLACGGLYLLWMCGHWMGQSVGFWDEIVFDSNDQFFTAHRRGYLLWGRRTVEIAFAQINQVTLTAGKEGRGPLPYSLSLRYRTREEPHRHWDSSFTVRGQNRRVDACELLQAIGRILDARGYIVREDTPSRAMWQLALNLVQAEPEPLAAEERETAGFERDEFDDDDDVAPEEEELILPISELPDLDRRAESQGIRQLPPVNQQLAAQVNVATINEKTVFTKLVDWIPGERVQLVTAQAPGSVFVVVAVFGALAGAAIGGWPVFGFLDSMLGQNVLWWPAAVTISALLGACGLTFIAWNQFQERVVEFDWRNRLVLYRLGSDLQERSFDDIRSVCLSGTMKHEYVGDDDHRKIGKTEYSCRLDLILTDRDVPLMTLDTWEPEQALARKILEPFGKSLAQALGSNCHWETTRKIDPADIRRILSLTFMQKAVLAVLLVIAVAGIVNGKWQKGMQQASTQAIRQSGADVVWMNGFSQGKKSVYREFWRVKFQKDPQVDEHLAQIRAELLKLPEYGLAVEDSPLSDQGLQQLEGQTGLRILDISNMRITDASLPAIGSCSQLVYINLYGSAVSDAGLEHLAKLQNLRFLYLGGTNVSDAGLATLRKCKGLEYIHLTRSNVTPAGAAKLRNQIPWVEVEYEVPK